MTAKSKFVNKISDIPVNPHYAIIRETSVHVPGDERSQTNPGHGYPASTEYFLSYEAFENRDDWEIAIERLTKEREMFRALTAIPPKITTTVSVSVVGGDR